jgi:hypothetical protein
MSTCEMMFACTWHVFARTLDLDANVPWFRCYYIVCGFFRCLYMFKYVHMCMCVCVCIYIYIYIYICVCIYGVYMRVYEDIKSGTCVCICVCMYACMRSPQGTVSASCTMDAWEEGVQAEARQQEARAERFAKEKNPCSLELLHGQVSVCFCVYIMCKYAHTHMWREDPMFPGAASMAKCKYVFCVYDM